MNSSTEKIAGLIPIVTAASVAAAIMFVSGYFNYFGVMWLTSLTLSDVIALAWAAFPVVSLSIATLALAANNPLIRRRGRKRAKPIRAKSFRGKAYLYLRHARDHVPLLIVPIALSMAVVPPEQAAYQFIQLSVIVILIASLVFITPRRIRRRGYIQIISLIVIIFSWSLGLQIGAGTITQRPRDVVVKHGGVENCTIAFFIGSRGVMHHNPVSGTTTLIPWEKIESVSRGRDCKAGVPKKDTVTPIGTTASGTKQITDKIPPAEKK